MPEEFVRPDLEREEVPVGQDNHQEDVPSDSEAGPSLGGLAQERMHRLLERVQSGGKVGKAAAMFAATTALVAGLGMHAEAAPRESAEPPERPAGIEKAEGQAKKEKSASPLEQLFAKYSEGSKEDRALMDVIAKLEDMRAIAYKVNRNNPDFVLNPIEFGQRNAERMVARFVDRVAFDRDPDSRKDDDKGERKRGGFRLNLNLDGQLGDLIRQGQELARERRQEKAERSKEKVERAIAAFENRIANAIAHDMAEVYGVSFEDHDALATAIEADRDGVYAQARLRNCLELIGLVRGIREAHGEIEQSGRVGRLKRMVLDYLSRPIP